MTETTALASALLTPAARDSAEFFEVVFGKVAENPPMGVLESWLASRLLERLGLFAREHGLGVAVVETLFVLDATRKLHRRPDLAFVSEARWPSDRPPGRENAWEVVPDLAVEIVSRSDLAEGLMEKIGQYFAAGVRQVWVVHPVVEQVHIYNAPDDVRIVGRDGILDGGEVVPDFRLALAELFGRAG